MSKILTALFILCIFAMTPNFALAKEHAKFEKGGVTSKTILGGALSLIVWPGIGQAINENDGKKVLHHAVVGLLPPFRFWSCYDAVVDRKGGYWDGKI